MNFLRRSYLVLAIVFAIAAIVLSIRWGVFHPLFFLPAVCFATGYMLCCFDESDAVIHVIAFPFCFLIATLAVGSAVIVETTREVTKVKKYEKILSGWPPALVHHFPARIPAGAENVRFSFLPHFMQGGAHIQLAYSTTSDTIAALYDKFSEMKTKSFIGGDTNDHMNGEEGMPTTFFFTSPTGEDSFPDDYEVMIFDRLLTEEERQEEYLFNHGEAHGVAISRKRNEIVYWAESW
jgi:hypothetical protein